MNDKEAKKEKRNGIIGAGFMLVLFLTISIIYGVSEKEFLFESNPKNVIDVVNETGKLDKGVYASVTLDNGNTLLIDWYAETKHYINGFIPSGKERHCIIFFDNNKFVSLTIKGKKNIKKVEDIINRRSDEAEDVNTRDTLTFEGVTRTMDPEILDYYKKSCAEYVDVLKDYGYSNSFEIYEVSIDAASTKFGGFLTLGFCVLMVFVSAWLLVSNIKGTKGEKTIDGEIAIEDIIVGDDTEKSESSPDGAGNNEMISGEVKLRMDDKE